MGNLVWLASYPKSGNTWLRAFIHNLIHDAEHPSRLADITAYFESESNPKWYQNHLSMPLQDASFDDLVRLRPTVQKAIAYSVERGSVLTKTHNQFTQYEGVDLHDLRLTSAAIYIVRNPLDVVVSTADHFGLTVDEAIEFMRNPNTATGSDIESVASYLGSWSDHVESWTSQAHQQFVVLRYEDLLDKTMHSFAQVAKLLGLDQDRSRIKKAIKFSTFRELKKQESAFGFSEKSTHSKAFFRQGKKLQWLNFLSEQQVAMIVEQHREQMLRFAYVPPKFR